ncbi:MAG: hypothetical protein ACE5J2_06750 [Nitrososphaerales archaeon]
MSTVLIDEITRALNRMKATGEFDQSIVNVLDRLANLFRESKEKWLTAPGTKASFYFFYGARNAELVIYRMKERFLSSKQVNDNLKIVDDSLQIIGLLAELLDLTRKEKPDGAVTKLTIEKVKELREVAANTKLLLAEEKELEDVDKLFQYRVKHEQYQ